MLRIPLDHPALDDSTLARLRPAQRDFSDRLAYYNKLAIVANKMPQKNIPKNVFLHLLMVGALYVAVFNFIALIFQFIDIWFPDQLHFYYDYANSGIRYSAALLMIILPVYLLASWLVGREIRRQPELREFSFRKWLIYLTIFITAIAIIGGLVTLVFNFMGGELTIRFLLKVLTVFAAAGTIFWYYLWDVKNKLSPALNKWLALAVVAAAAAAIIVSFLLIGSPFYQRRARLDEQRINHLQILQNEIINYWTNKNKLPEKLADLNNATRGFITPLDPENKENYGYEIAGPLSFKLCANFSTARTAGNDARQKEISYAPAYPTPAGISQSSWFHGESRHCFDREIDPDFFSKKPRD